MFLYLLLGPLIVQIGLDALTVLSVKSVAITTAHVSTGALLLVTCVFVTLYMAKIVCFLSKESFGQFDKVAVT